MQGKDGLLNYFSNVFWEARLAYLADVFEQQNRFKLKLQSKERNPFHLMDCLHAFLAKLQNWQRKVGVGNVAMFENFSVVLDEKEENPLLGPWLKTEITQCLRSLESEHKNVVPRIRGGRRGVMESILWHSLSLDSLPLPVMFRSEWVILMRRHNSLMFSQNSLILKIILLPKISLKKIPACV